MRKGYTIFFLLIVVMIYHKSSGSTMDSLAKVVSLTSAGLLQFRESAVLPGGLTLQLYTGDSFWISTVLLWSNVSNTTNDFATAIHAIATRVGKRILGLVYDTRDNMTYFQNKSKSMGIFRINVVEDKNGYANTGFQGLFAKI